MLPYPIPEEIKHMDPANLKAYCDILAEDFSSLELLFEWCPETIQAHKQLWSHLLFQEECCLEKNYEMYDLDGVPMTRSGSGLVELAVPGLAEARPSVLKGDRILVHVAGAPREVFEGYVHVVQQSSVLLKFSPNFHHRDNANYDVKFVLPRRSLRMQHQSIHLLKRNISPWTIHPQVPPIDFTDAISGLEFYNGGLNETQRDAVERILHRSTQRAQHQPPYVIFGPPGNFYSLQYTVYSLHC